jgi:hypothetical protein
MKKSKFFILTGAVTLAILGVYARKPYTAVTQVYAGTTYATLFTGATSSVLTTNSNSGSYKTAQFKTKSASTWVTMLTSSGGSKVYYHP